MLPLLGIAAGAQLTGGALQAYGGYKASEAQARAERRRQDMINRAYDSVTPYYRSILDQLPVNQQLEALRQWRPAEMQEFDTAGYDVESYLDPSMDYQQEQARRQLQAGQAVSGTMMSGAAQKQLQDRAMDIARTGYGDAFNRMQTDRNFGYQAFRDRFQAAQQAATLDFNRLQGLANTSLGATDSLAGLATGRANALSPSISAMGTAQGAMTAAPFSSVGQGLAALGSPENIGTAYGISQGALPKGWTPRGVE